MAVTFSDHLSYQTVHFWRTGRDGLNSSYYTLVDIMQVLGLDKKNKLVLTHEVSYLIFMLIAQLFSILTSTYWSGRKNFIVHLLIFMAQCEKNSVLWKNWIRTKLIIIMVTIKQFHKTTFGKYQKIVKQKLFKYVFISTRRVLIIS